jgi:hypothetical protein
MTRWAAVRDEAKREQIDEMCAARLTNQPRAEILAGHLRGRGARVVSFAIASHKDAEIG